MAKICKDSNLGLNLILRILIIHHQDNMKINRRIWRVAVKVSMEMQSKEDLLPKLHSKIKLSLVHIIHSFFVHADESIIEEL